MAISVDIADRLYDYTDEERASEAVALFQLERELDDKAILTLWDDLNNPLRVELDRRITDAVDANGSARRARDNVPDGVSLQISEM